MPSETDSPAQGADRQEQVSSLYSLLIQPEKNYFTRTFSVVYEKASICEHLIFLCVGVTKTVCEACFFQQKKFTLFT